MAIDNSNLTNEAINDVTITAILQSNSAKYGLYKNPKIQIELPEEVEKYLEPGEQTKISPEIQRIADSIEGNTLEKAQGILNWGREVIGRGEFTNRR